MLALDRTHVDYFSLDVEGFEYDILQTVPWSMLDVSTLSIEYVHGRLGKDGYKAYMKNHGYEVAADIHFHDPQISMFTDDLIFVKEGISKVSQK